MNRSETFIQYLRPKSQSIIPVAPYSSSTNQLQHLCFFLMLQWMTLRVFQSFLLLQLVHVTILVLVHQMMRMSPTSNTPQSPRSCESVTSSIPAPTTHLIQTTTTTHSTPALPKKTVSVVTNITTTTVTKPEHDLLRINWQILIQNHIAIDVKSSDIGLLTIILTAHLRRILVQPKAPISLITPDPVKVSNMIEIGKVQLYASVWQLQQAIALVLSLIHI